MKWLIPPILVLTCLVAMAALAIWCPWRAILPWPWPYLGLLPAVAGLALAFWGSRLFGRIGTNINTFRAPGTLVTTGPFAFTRNPMYLGFLLLLAGAALASNAATAFLPVALFFVVANSWYIPFEEAAMVRQFGDSYRAYAARIRRWI